MELIANNEKMSFPMESVAKSDYLTGLYETFGPSCVATCLSEDELKLLFRVLVVNEEIKLDELLTIDALCVDLKVVERSLQSHYDYFVYIVGEHTGIIPRIDCVDLDHKEIQQIKEMYPEDYTHIESIMSLQTFFHRFEESLPDEHLSPPTHHAELIERKIRFGRVFVCDEFKVNSDDALYDTHFNRYDPTSYQSESNSEASEEEI